MQLDDLTKEAHTRCYAHQAGESEATPALGAALGKTAGAAAGYDAPRGRPCVAGGEGGDATDSFLSAALEATPQISKEEKEADRGGGG